MFEIAAQQPISIPTIAIKYPHTKHRITSNTAPLFPFPIFPNNSSSTHHTKRISTPHLSPCALVQDSALAVTAKKARRSCAVSLGLKFRIDLSSVSCFLFLVSCSLFRVSSFEFRVSISRSTFDSIMKWSSINVKLIELWADIKIAVVDMSTCNHWRRSFVVSCFEMRFLKSL